MPRETTRSLLSDIAQVIGTVPSVPAEGGTELKSFLTDIVKALDLPLNPTMPKLKLAEAIVREAGLTWDADCDSRNTKSKGGGTIKNEGLRRIRTAVTSITLHRRQHDNEDDARYEGIAEEAGDWGSDGQIVLEELPEFSEVTITTDAFTGPRSASQQRLLLESAVNGHSSTLRQLAAAAEVTGAHAQQGRRSIDLLATWPDRWSLLAEVKTVPNEVIARTRLGLSQLFEYRFRHGASTAMALVLVFDRKPAAPGWLLSFVTVDRGVNVLWRDDAGFRVLGPDAVQLMKRLANTRAAPE